MTLQSLQYMNLWLNNNLYNPSTNIFMVDKWWPSIFQNLSTSTQKMIKMHTNSGADYVIKTALMFILSYKPQTQHTHPSWHAFPKKKTSATKHFQNGCQKSKRAATKFIFFHLFSKLIQFYNNTKNKNLYEPNVNQYTGTKFYKNQTIPVGAMASENIDAQGQKSVSSQ